MGPLA